MRSKGAVHYEAFYGIEAVEKEGYITPDRANVNENEKMFVGVFFEDRIIDLTAEMMALKTRMSSLDCVLDFKNEANEMFERFNARQLQAIYLTIFSK